MCRPRKTCPRGRAWRPRSPRGNKSPRGRGWQWGLRPCTHYPRGRGSTLPSYFPRCSSSPPCTQRSFPAPCTMSHQQRSSPRGTGLWYPRPGPQRKKSPEGRAPALHWPQGWDSKSQQCIERTWSWWSPRQGSCPQSKYRSKQQLARAGLQHHQKFLRGTASKPLHQRWRCTTPRGRARRWRPGHSSRGCMWSCRLQ